MGVSGKMMIFEISKNKQIKKKLGCLIILLVIIFYGYQVIALPRYTIFFYSPESNINNFSSLKIEFDTYLSEFGPFQFQPFSEYKVFEEMIRDRSDGLFVLSSWHYKQLRHNYSLTPVLVGSLKGKISQKRVLTVLKNVSGVDGIRGGIVASAGNEIFTRNVLSDMLDEQQLVDSCKVLTVPKDIDALMSVTFRMADAAVTTENSLNKLAKLNPKQYKMLKILMSGNETLRPIVAVPAEKTDNLEQLISTIENMGSGFRGRTRLRMLGLDGWKKINSTELNEIINDKI
jgi:hypothetical protein